MAESKEKKGHEEVENNKDRLSHLPNDILFHILSFLPNTKFRVRTSVLSKRWNCLWASGPHLVFDRFELFNPRFKKFVLSVLSRRDNLSDVTKFTFKYHRHDNSFITRVINYAVSHNVRHLTVCLIYSSFEFLSPFLHNCRSLKALELEHFRDSHQLEYCTLPSLTTLSLTYCEFGSSPLDSALFDPFVRFVNLKSLQLCYCHFRNFKITGPLLDNLTILNRHNNAKVEIVSPKLRSFSLKEDTYDGVQFFGLDFPLLEVADMCFSFPSGKEARVKWRLNLMDMFRGLCNAQSLVLSSKIIKGLMKCPGVLEDQASPFVRLKTLKVKCHSSSFNIPHDVIKYFGENIKVEKILEVFAVCSAL